MVKDKKRSRSPFSRFNTLNSWFCTCLDLIIITIIHFTIVFSTFEIRPCNVIGDIIDSYLGMDQQQELKLDVQKAPAPPTDHPQWDLSESEPEHNDQHENLSDYPTDSSDEENDSD